MKLHETRELARQWETATHTSLYRFISGVWIVAGDAIPDMDKLERWLKPAEGESVRRALVRQYGETAGSVIEQLLER